MNTRYPVQHAPNEPDALQLEDIAPPTTSHAASLLSRRHRRKLSTHDSCLVHCESGWERDLAQRRVYFEVQGSDKPVYLRPEGTWLGSARKLVYPREQMRFFHERYTGRGVVNVECVRCANYSRWRFNLEANPLLMHYNAQKKEWTCQLCRQVRSLASGQRVLPCAVVEKPRRREIAQHFRRTTSSAPHRDYPRFKRWCRRVVPALVVAVARRA